MSLPWRTLATATTAEGLLELRQRGDSDLLMTIAGRVLMSSAARRSEEALATLALAKLKPRPSPRVLVSGLGMGFTLRAALDVLPPTARVVVAEISPEVVSWCLGPLAPATHGAALDVRVQVITGDVARLLSRSAPGEWDAILLDLYEGPHAATQRADDPFYGAAALARTRAALSPGGVLGVWGEDPDPSFLRRFGQAGFEVTQHRPGKGGRAHVVYIGERR